MTDDAGTYSDAIGSLIDQTKRLAKAEAEVTRLRAIVARVEALADEWERIPDFNTTPYEQGRGDWRRMAISELVGALHVEPETNAS